jgi:hypothetical protein
MKTEAVMADNKPVRTVNELASEFIETLLRADST